MARLFKYNGLRESSKLDTRRSLPPSLPPSLPASLRRVFLAARCLPLLLLLLLWRQATWFEPKLRSGLVVRSLDETR